MARSKKHSASLAAAAILAAAAGAIAQTAPTGAAATATSSPDARSPGAGASEPSAAKPSNNNMAMQTAAMLSRSGGSLLQASLAVPSDPGQVKLSSVSFFAVPDKEPKVLKKHDLVTILVNEVSTATSKGTNDFTKNAELKAEIAQMIRLKLGKGTIEGLTTPTAAPGIDFTGLRSFQGAGEVDRSDSITARITAEILDVKPNGTILLQARKRIKTDEEDQQFILSGICRAEDITPDNSVLSTQLYDLQLQKNSKGDVHQATERGNIPKLLDFLNPF